MAAISGPNIPLDGLVFNMDPASALSYPARNDPYRDQISLLLDGTTLTDKSGNNFTVTVNGNTQIVSDSTFGNAISFDGNGDYLTVSDNAKLEFGLVDLTIELWIKTDSSTQYATLLSRTPSSFNSGMWSLMINHANSTAGDIALYIGDYSLPNYLLRTSNINIRDNAWHHIAVVRSGSSWVLYVDGQSRATNLWSGTITDINGAINIGRDQYYTRYFQGLIGPTRLTKVARYTANFTPPRELNVFQSQIKDIKNDIVGTFTNGPVFSNVQKGAISFDGSDDYIIIPGNSNLAFGTSDFAIELWFKTRNKTSLYPNIIGTNSAWAANVWSLTDRHASLNPTKLTLHVYNIGNNVLVSNTAIQNNTWYHLVITRIGNNFYMYLNGALESTYISSNSFDGGVSNNIAIGIANNSTNAYDGSIPYLRVYKNRGFTLSDVLKNYNATRERFVEIPKTISGLQLWLDAADLSTLRQNSNGTTAVVASSDPIGYWADKSGNGRNATQATAGNRPLFNIDSTGPYLNLNGSSSVLTGSWPLTLSEETVYIILSLSSGGYTSGRVFTQYNTSISSYDWNVIGAWIPCLRRSSTTVGASARVSMSPAITSSTSNAISLDTNYIYGAFNDGFYNTSQINNNSLALGDNSGVTHNNTYNTYAIGREPNYNGYVQGKIREVIVFNRFLSDNERAVIKNYLNKKWGVV